MSSESSAGTSRIADVSDSANPPLNGLPLFSRLPDVQVMWHRLLIVVWIVMAYEAVVELMWLVMQYWFMESFDQLEVFWTNFWAGACAFVVGLVAFSSSIILPAFLHNVSQQTRRATIHFGLIVGVFAGYFMMNYYLDFLLLMHGGEFGKTDPVFGNDIGFYVFSLPSYWTIWGGALACLMAGLYSSIRCSCFNITEEESPQGTNRIAKFFQRCSTPCTLGYVTLIGVLMAIEPVLARYDVLYKNIRHLRIRGGAGYVDINGLFSTVNSYWLTAAVVLGITAAVVSLLKAIRNSDNASRSDTLQAMKKAGMAIALLLMVDLCFNLVIWGRQVILVSAEEPVIQLPHIKDHIDFTMDAYDLDDVEVVNFLPKGDGDPLPNAEELLASPAIQNAPIWPGYVAYLETMVDPQHAELILAADGDNMVYGPTKELFRQQQKLRMYYDISNVDSVRYDVDGERQMFVSAVRELPKYAPEPWLYHWGQRMLWYTHGYGIIAAPASEVTADGNPSYVVSGVPAKSEVPALELSDPRIYFGEESASPFLSNVKGFSEFGNPTDDTLVTSEFPQDAESGVYIDSFIKRLILGWSVYNAGGGVYGRTFWEILVSGMITEDTKLHFWRRPIERLERVAPFLFYDTNSWAVVADDGELVWMVNALTTSKMYPYSYRRLLGDKATIRSKFPRDNIMANYIRDSVKCTVNATTGVVKFYKFEDEPIVNTWANIYPSLFIDEADMPAGVRAHLQYPLQFFHRQFDDVYKAYHMRNPLDYFNMEDLWDDCDEVLGPIRDKGDAVTFSFEPFQWVADTGDGVLPQSDENSQFTMGMPFTNEKALNVRAIPMVYQDGDDYGKKFCVMFPKGTYRMSPEQADAAIDQEPTISEQISWWNRLGNDVIHGHTTPLIANGEMIYVEPLFIRSQQEPYSQLKKVCVVFRGTARMGNTLEEALRSAIEAKADTDDGARLSSRPQEESTVE